jgi:hypothetical protein
MPVCRVGVQCSAAYHGRVVFRVAGGHLLVVTTDRHGRAMVTLPAGTYDVTAPANDGLPRLASVTLNGRAVPRAVDGSYRVSVGVTRVDRLQLDLDTGIR